MKLETAYQTLTPAERSFVDRYVEALEIAAQRSGLSMRAAFEIAPKTDDEIRRPMVRVAINDQVEAIHRARTVNPERILQELQAIAFGHLGQLITVCDISGTMSYDLSKLTPQEWAMVKKITFDMDPNGRPMKVSIDTHSKMDALSTMVRLLEAENAGPMTKKVRELITGIDPEATIEEAADLYAKALTSPA